MVKMSQNERAKEGCVAQQGGDTLSDAGTL